MVSSFKNKTSSGRRAVSRRVLRTEDGQRIALRYYRNNFPCLVIIAPGFYNNKDTVLFEEIAVVLHKSYDIIAFDFRGHGKSTGLFSWTAHEPRDLRTVVAYAKKEGYARVGALGFSLGASTTLIEAARNTDIDSVIAVSGVSDFLKINAHFWEPDMLEDLKVNIGKKGKGKGVRPGNPFLPKVRPLDVVQGISPRPVLFVHGKEDWLIKPEHSQAMFEKAREPKALTFIEGAGHAERIFDSFPERFEALCVEWFNKTLLGEAKT